MRSSIRSISDKWDLYQITVWSIRSIYQIFTRVTGPKRSLSLY